MCLFCRSPTYGLPNTKPGFYLGVSMREHDITKKDVIDTLRLSGIKKNSQKLIDYEYAKWLLDEEWNDFVAREVTKYVGI